MYDQERIDKLFSKLDLSGCDSWSEKQKQMVRECIIKHNRVFAVDDLELGKTDLVKHEIKLNNYVPLQRMVSTDTPTSIRRSEETFE